MFLRKKYVLDFLRIYYEGQMMEPLVKSGAKILLIDDSEDDPSIVVQMISKGNLSARPYRINSLDGLGSALDRDTWDVIFCKKSLENLNPFDIFDMLKERDLKTPFFVFSSIKGDNANVQVSLPKLRENNVSDYLIRLVPAFQQEIEDAVLRHEQHWAIDQLEKYKHESERIGNSRVAERIETINQLRSFAYALPEGVIFTDMRGNITDLNPAAEKLIGCEATNVIGKAIPEILHIFTLDGSTPIDPLLGEISDEKELAKHGDFAVVHSKTGENHYVSLKTALFFSDMEEYQRIFIELYDLTTHESDAGNEETSGKLAPDVVQAKVRWFLLEGEWATSSSVLKSTLLKIRSFSFVGPYKNIFTARVQFSSPEWQDVITALKKVPNIIHVGKWGGDGNDIILLIIFKGLTFMRVLLEVGLDIQFPIVIQNDIVTWEFLALRDTFDKFIESMEKTGVKHEIVFIKSFKSQWDQERLTERQEKVLDLASELGYFEIPRRVTLKELADKLNIATSTLSGILRRISQKKLVQSRP